MTWVKVEYEDINTFKWNEVRRFDLCEVYKNGRIIVQIYPHNLLKSEIKHSDELTEYDRRVDGKRYFCDSIMENGYTPNNLIATCRDYNVLTEVVDAVLKCKESD